MNRDGGNEQLMQLAKKLDMDVTADMFEGQCPEDVTNAIIGAALEAWSPGSETVVCRTVRRT